MMFSMHPRFQFYCRWPPHLSSHQRTLWLKSFAYYWRSIPVWIIFTFGKVLGNDRYRPTDWIKIIINTNREENRTENIQVLRIHFSEPSYSLTCRAAVPYDGGTTYSRHLPRLEGQLQGMRCIGLEYIFCVLCGFDDPLQYLCKADKITITTTLIFHVCNGY